MIRFASGCLSAVLLACVACGQVEQPLGGVVTGGAGGLAAGGAGAGGQATGTGGSGGMNAVAGGSGGCPAEKPTCLTACYDDRIDNSALTCEAGQWQCGPGFVDSKTCGPNTLGGCTGQARFNCQPSCTETGSSSIAQCVDGKFACDAGWVNPKDPKSCPASCDPQLLTALCCFPNGKWQNTPCDANGPGACPDGSTSVPNQCRPTGIDVAACSDLDGKACSSSDLFCSDTGFCHPTCSCELNQSGQLAWLCLYPVC